MMNFFMDFLSTRLFLLLALTVTVSQCQGTPKFTKNILTLVVMESEEPGYYIDDLSKYVEYNDKSALTYGIDGAGAVYLDVEQTNGTITLKIKLDRENVQIHPIYTAHTSAFINGENVQAFLKVLLVASDVNDSTPTLSGPVQVDVAENTEVGSTIVWLSATDRDQNEKGEVNITFVLPTDVFGLQSFAHNNTAKLTLLKKLDYETTKYYTLKLKATDLGVEQLSSTSLLTVNVQDVSDTNPVFSSSPYNKYVLENLQVGSSVLKVKAIDGDTGINDEILYNIVQNPDDQSNMFTINQETGVVYIASPLDRDTTYTYSFTVKATEKTDKTSTSDVSVVIFPEDVNDNAPLFQMKNYVIKVSENTPIGTVIYHDFIVSDADILPINKKFIYSLTPGFDMFAINPSTGYLSVNRELDYETNEKITFTVFATESETAEKYSGNASVTVELQNVNDNQPKFVSTAYTFTVMENVTESDVLGYVKAIDEDAGSYGVVTYSIVGGSPIFSINSTSGALHAKVGLDADTKSTHKLTIAASDTSQFTSNSVTTLVTIQLTDVNDNIPVFTNIPIEVTLEENKRITDLITLKASDADSGTNAEFFFALVNTSYSPAYVTVNPTSGLVRVLSQIDYEQVKSFEITVTVTDRGTPSLSSVSSLTVLLKDENDNPPIFNQSSYSGTVMETPNAGAFILQVFASDADDGINAELVYTITKGNNDSIFTISNDGKISTINALDREMRDLYELTITVSDKGTPSLKSLCEVLIQVVDANDERPIFDQAEYTANVNESASVGSHVVRITAHDKDIDRNARIEYSIFSGNENLDFLIDKNTGVVTLNHKLDRETKARFNLVVKAQDQGLSPLWRTVNLIINVIDNNDNPPEFTTDKQFYTFTVYENFPTTSLGFVSASDKDGTLPSYFITAGNEEGAFFIEEAIGSLHTNTTLDREQKDFYNLTITAVDNGSPPLKSSIQCHVNVLDLNDNQPKFEKSVYRVSVYENETVGAEIFQVFATDEDLGLNGVVKFMLQNPPNPDNDKFGISEDGKLKVKHELDYEVQKEYTLTVIAQDSGRSKLTSTATIFVSVLDVNDNAPYYAGEGLLSNVYEAQPIGEEFFQVKGKDNDEGTNSVISYIIVNVTSVTTPVNSTGGLFSVDRSSGVLTTRTVLNRDVESKYKITISMEDHGSPPLSSYVTILVDVLDWNTHPPIFHNLPAILNISDVTSKGIPLYQVNATDADEGENARMNFRTLSGSKNQFRIDSKTGIIWTTTTSTERNSIEKTFVLVILAGVSPQTSNSTLTIQFVNTGSKKPIFEPDPNIFPQLYVKTVKENTPVNQPIIDLNATHQNEAGNVFLKYSITDQDSDEYFQIDEFSGAVSFRKTVDREKNGLVLDNGGFGVLTFIVSVSTNLEPSEVLSVKVTILIDDVNDNPPLFDDDEYKTAVSESANVGHVVTTVTATDRDLGYNGRIVYKIVDGNNKGAFSMFDNYTGTIVVSNPLNKEQISQYNLTIQATDEGYKLNGGSSLSSYTKVFVFIGDVNDNDPIFSENAYTANLQEGSAIGSVVLKIVATDKDDGNNGRVWYQISSGNENGHFRINNSTGDITVNGVIDRENISSYTLIVQASDHGFPLPRKTTVEVFITINDVNDNAPLFKSSTYSGTVFENQPIGTTIDVIPVIQSFDVDIDNTLSYFFNETNESRFKIDKETAIITTATILDRESVEEYVLLIRVEDQGGFYTTANISIAVHDTNDNAPLFSSSTTNITASEGLPVESVVYVAQAEDLDMGTNSKIIYTLSKSSNVFEMIRETGELKLISQLDREETTSYNLTIIATDSGTPPEQSNMTLTIYVADTIDTKPFFRPSELTFDILENIPVNTTLFTVQAKDLDLNDVLSYNITYASTKNLFQIDVVTGEVSLVKPLDREFRDFYTIFIQATDSAALQSAADALEVSFSVVDVNDNAPAFLNSNCRIDVTDETPDNSIIYIVSATDQDLGSNGEVSYSLASNIAHILRLNSTRGIIRKHGDLRPYIDQSVNFTVTATDKGGEFPLFSTLHCVLNVINVGSEAPKFQQPTFKISVKEDLQNGSVIGTFPAAMETGNNQQILYILYGGQGLFGVNKTVICYGIPQPGSIYTTGKLDQETLSLLVFTLVAEDGETSNRGIAIFTVTITDVNDNYPQFTRNEYHFRVREDAITSVAIGTVEATDLDSGFNSKIEYRLQPSPFGQYFRIDSSSGIIYPDMQLDRETKDEYEFTIMAADHGFPSLSSFVQVKIKITDVNDNKPIFQQHSYRVVIPENTGGGTMIATVEATDKDIEKNGEIVYSITQGNDGSHFVCGEISGKIFVAKPLDIETQPNFTLVVNATDRGMPSLTSAVMVTIQLTDVNDEYPRFNNTMYSFSLYENTSLDAFVGRVYAVDGDVLEENSLVYYGWKKTGTSDGKDSLNTTFTINEHTGVIMLKGQLDYEGQTSYTLTAIAFNKMSATSSNKTMISEVQVTIHVLDINDHSPSLPPSCCSVNVSEGAAVNDELFTLKATDQDGDEFNKISYIIQYGNVGEHFFLSSEGVLSLKKKLNREEISAFTLRIKASDSGRPPLSGFGDIRIMVTDMNDEVPQLQDIDIPKIPENSPLGTRVVTFTAVDKDLGVNGVVSFTIISGNENGDFKLNESTGVLVTTKRIDYERVQNYDLKIQAKDHGIPSLSSWKLFTIQVENVNDNNPTFSELQVSAIVPENSPAGTIVTTIKATDPDNDPINYFIIDGNENQLFTLESATGILRTSKILDREEKGKYVLTIEASNSDKNPVKQSKRRRRLIGNAMVQTVEVIVGDVNDNPPRFVQKLFSAGISEDIRIGSRVLRVQAVDPDSGILSYEISNQNKFSINQWSGWVVTEQTFFNEDGQIYQLNIVVKDNEGRGNYSQDTAVVKIFVLTDAQRVLLVMNTQPDLVRANKTDFVRNLENCTKYSITVDEIDYEKKDDGEYDKTRTVLSFHGVEEASNTIAHRDNVLREMDANKLCLETFFQKWNLTKYTGRPIPLKVTSVNDDSWVIIGIVIACIFVIAIVIVVIGVRRRRKSRDKRTIESEAGDNQDGGPRRRTVHIRPLSTTFLFDDDTSVYQPKDSYTIPEPENPNKPAEMEDTNFSTFHGTLEPGDGHYLEQVDLEMANEPVKPEPTNNDNLTLLEVIAIQEAKEKQGMDNKGIDMDDLESQCTDATESVIDDGHENDDVVTVPIYDFDNFKDTKL